METISADDKNPLLVLGIYLSVFINSYVFFTSPFEFQFGYLIFILLLPRYFANYSLNRNIFLVFTLLLLSGIFNIILENNTAALFFKVYIGLAMSYIFYNFVIVDFNYNVDRLFRWYLKGAFIASLLGIFQFVSFLAGFRPGYTFWKIFNKWSFAPGGIFGIRVNSVFSEPTHLAAVLSAAFLVAAYNLLMRKTYGLNRTQSIIVMGVYFLSFSGLGQAGIFITLILLAINYGFVRYVLVVVPLVIVLFNYFYNNVDDFRTRYDSLIGLSEGAEFELGKTHGSSFILYNNLVVASANFKQNFVFGTGIGSHPVAFEKYSIAKEIKTYGFNLNSADANSIFLRLMSETGLFGIGIFLIIIFKCYVRRDPDDEPHYWLISNGILVMILLNMFRQGHYFLNGFPFFVLMYIYNWQRYQTRDEDVETTDKPLNPETT